MSPLAGEGSDVRERTPRFIITCLAVGLAAGLLSGLFGVGGGTVIVPLLVLILGFDQRLASGTSLAAIVPTASVGVISYATTGSVAIRPRSCAGPAPSCPQAETSPKQVSMIGARRIGWPCHADG